PSIEEALSSEPNPPKTQLQLLEDSLAAAIKSEDYETAARIRDQIKKIIESS
ncbi:MAG TPA: UvrB/UvrC motif-containing protein, partial [Leptospiraceae bacterium]|nr:UvrB/UvrC motif-containing protein [Leptospiraceae bacterium]